MVVVHAPAELLERDDVARSATVNGAAITNLMGVCWHHHHLLHEGGWNASGDADAEITLTSPHGRRLHSRVGPMAA